MPRPRYPDDAYSPSRKASLRSPHTPSKRSHHRARRYPESEMYDDFDEEYDEEPAPTPVSRMHRLSRMLVQPWQTGHLPPMPPLPAHYHQQQPEAERSHVDEDEEEIRKASASIIWAKGAAILTAGISCLGFIGAFSFDKYLTVSMPGFSDGDDRTEAQTIIVAFGDPSSLPPGSTLASWSAGSMHLFLEFASLMAAASCLLTILTILHGAQIRSNLPAGLKATLSGLTECDGVIHHTTPVYGPARVKLWLFGVWTALPTFALVLVLRALSETASYMHTLAQVGNASKVVMSTSTTLTIGAFAMMLASWAAHVQEQRRRVHRCRLEDRSAMKAPYSAPFTPAQTVMPPSAGLQPQYQAYHDEDELEDVATTFNPADGHSESYAPPVQRKRSRPRKAKPTAPTETMTEMEPVTPASRPAKRLSLPKKTERWHAAEPDTPSSSRTAREVFAEWGQPLQ